MTKRRDGKDKDSERLVPATTDNARDQLERPDTVATPATVRRMFGLPVGVTRVVPLPRAPTEREWGQFVAELRTTFGVQGRVTTSGALREWSHGNLHVSLEPTADGEQLRLSDVKEDAVVINGMGFLIIALGAVLGAVTAATGNPGKAVEIIGVMGGVSLLPFFGANLFRTPAWARERERQMVVVAEHAVRLLSSP